MKRSLAMNPPEPEIFDAAIEEILAVCSQDRSEWTVKTRLPTVPHLAQLSALGMAFGHWFKKSQERRLNKHQFSDVYGALAALNKKAKDAWTAATSLTQVAERAEYLSNVGQLAYHHRRLQSAWNKVDGELKVQRDLSYYTDDVGRTLQEINREMGVYSDPVRCREKTDNLPAEMRTGMGAAMALVHLGTVAPSNTNQLEDKNVISSLWATFGGKYRKDSSAGSESDRGSAQNLSEVRRELRQLRKHLPD